MVASICVEIRESTRLSVDCSECAGARLLRTLLPSYFAVVVKITLTASKNEALDNKFLVARDPVGV